MHIMQSACLSSVLCRNHKNMGLSMHWIYISMIRLRDTMSLSFFGFMENIYIFLCTLTLPRISWIYVCVVYNLYIVWKTINFIFFILCANNVIVNYDVKENLSQYDMFVNHEFERQKLKVDTDRSYWSV